MLTGDRGTDLGKLLKAGSTDVMQEVLAAIYGQGGNLVHVARELKVSHRSLCRWQKKYSEIGHAVVIARQHSDIVTG